MKMLLNLSILIIMIELMLNLILNLISKKTFMDYEKNSPFECGFNPKMSARFSFSLHFFFIAVIFLIFDVEITLLIPMILSLKIMNMFNYLMIFSFFSIILLTGVYYEWNQGALNWKF
nr:NADH dehydrogenase subunit 3 [Donacia flemola]